MMVFCKFVALLLLAAVHLQRTCSPENIKANRALSSPGQRTCSSENIKATRALFSPLTRTCSSEKIKMLLEYFLVRLLRNPVKA
jgi:hypothetical protein